MWILLLICQVIVPSQPEGVASCWRNKTHFPGVLVTVEKDFGLVLVPIDKKQTKKLFVHWSNLKRYEAKVVLGNLTLGYEIWLISTPQNVKPVTVQSACQMLNIKDVQLIQKLVKISHDRVIKARGALP